MVAQQQGETPVDDAECAAGRKRLFTTWLTSVDGVDHAITDEMMAVGVRSCRGQFTTVCQDIVTAAFLVVPPGRRCPRCWEALNPTPVGPEPEPARRTRRARLRDLLDAHIPMRPVHGA